MYIQKKPDYIGCPALNIKWFAAHFIAAKMQLFSFAHLPLLMHVSACGGLSFPIARAKMPKGRGYCGNAGNFPPITGRPFLHLPLGWPYSRLLKLPRLIRHPQ